ncbi:MAG TPA: DNA polymerase II [Candidatus Nanoarchaeia archaeon]|nr:DNA polymerase II [Candidatus Nanoarchaeia archaeon]
MKGFILYPTYRIENNKALVYLFGRLENGESFLTISESRPYFYIKKSDLDKALKLQLFDHETTNKVDFKGNQVCKVVMNIPREVPDLRHLLEEQGIVCYEADIRFAIRFLIDRELQGAVDIGGEYKQGSQVDRIYENPTLKSCDYTPANLKVLSIDIEMDRTMKKIFCISLYMPDFQKVIIVSKQNLKHTITVDSEEELLKKFSEFLLKLDPDIITGWNVIDFDLSRIQELFKKYKIPFQLGRTGWECKIRRFESFFQDSTADFSGRMVLDGMALLKWSFIKLEDYKLETAAQAFLGEGKLIHGGIIDRCAEVEKFYEEDQQKLVDYNLKDSELVFRILEKTGTLKLSIQRSLLTGMPLDRIKASVASFDSVYLKELKKRNIVAPSLGFESREQRIKGGYVMESKPGIYDFLIVCDFKSLYPSIIRTFNIDPYSFVEDCQGKNLVKAPNGACFRNEDGILPLMIERLGKQRDLAKKEKNEVASYAIKTLMNSFWGVLASPMCRFYSFTMANGITHFGQYVIKLTAKKITEMGYEVIYSDTDSVFINSKASSVEEAEKVGNQVQGKIDAFFEEHVKKEYQRKSCLDLQFEKVYIRFLMPKVRSGEEGSKKRYAGLLMKDGKEEVKFVGLEAVRRDWTDLAKKFQHELFDKVFHKQEVADYVRSFVKDLKSGKLDQLLMYRKAIRKELGEYTKTTPPHVKAARLMENRESNLIEYVMTLNGPEPWPSKNKIDYDHYLDKQLKPIADTVLVFFNQNFDDIMKGSEQRTLFGFG